ncbi:hypothetical protein KKC91_10540 [bacterium]|nr:hypothetical protein [bacterium]
MEELVEMMDRTGVGKGILLPGISPECRKQFSTVEDTMDVCEKYPGSFLSVILIREEAILIHPQISSGMAWKFIFEKYSDIPKGL